eukprot:gnl/MRDRNA2_/MRDRNA2_17880_c0_seq1.p1 gnl/MRDRNA2_/MRDRNA2_17880_c0~~gnl/MRDRNA2_/MRDRNA2_17880_c0_seq1.p1  ORF type:complete len:288 (-),score=61.45 gnl/MRDRNA2_/MRDRNA2_17880_c0_seq1:75-938(-)
MPGIDYNKWDSIVDSDEEEIQKQEKIESFERDEFYHQQSEAVELDLWLQQRFLTLADEEASEAGNLKFGRGLRRKKRSMSLPTDDQRRALAFFIAIQFAHEGSHNLDKHLDIVETLRHQSWICTQATLELLCRLHNQLLHQIGESESSKDTMDDGPKRPSHPKDKHFREMVFSAINTVAGPLKEECSPFEFISEITTLSTERARERREKYQERKYGKDALFDTLCGDLNLRDDNDEEEDGHEIWLFWGIMLFLAVALIVAIVVMWYHDRSASRKAKSIGWGQAKSDL